MNDASMLLARVVRREHRVATVMLTVLVGVTGAIPMVGWEVARRTDRALPEFVERSGAPDATVFTCPTGYVPDIAADDEEAGTEFFDVCMRNRSLDFAAPLSELAGIDAVAPAAFVVGELDLGNGVSEIVGMDVGFDPDGPATTGKGMVIDGRALDQRATGEVMLDEFGWATRPPGMELGSTAVFTPFLASQPHCASGVPCDPEGDPVTVTLVGVKRMPSDLATNTEGSGGLSLSAGFWATQADPEVFTYGVGYAVWLADGVGIDDLEASLAASFVDRFTFVDRADDSRLDTLSDAISYQSGAARVFALLAALAGLVFAGQALARQTRRETKDAEQLTALGMERREIAVAVALRSLPIAIGGALLAAAVAVLASPIGPIGIARATIPGPSISVDPVVVLVGSIGVVASALACATLPVLRRERRRTLIGAPVRVGSTRLPAPVLTGVRAALPRRGGPILPAVLGVAGTAVAAASVVAASTLGASLGEVTSEPAHYGVAWDALVGNNGSPEDERESFSTVTAVEGIAAASGVMSTTVTVDDVELPLLALVPVPGIEPIEPIIIEGRAPYRANEAALGVLTMRTLGVGIGDVVEFELSEFPGAPVEATIVGTAALNDGIDIELGHGMLVDGTWARSQAPGSSAQAVAVMLEPGREAQATVELAERFGQFVSPPEPSSSIRHLVRVDDLPAMLATVVVMLAVASSGHMMWVSVRQRRFELGVLSALGFLRRQVWSSIVSQAVVIAVLAVAIGVPLGLIGGGWAWRAIAGAVGIEVGPTIATWSIVACMIGALVVAMIAAALPGWRAAHDRPAAALRAE